MAVNDCLDQALALMLKTGIVDRKKLEARLPCLKEITDVQWRLLLSRYESRNDDGGSSRPPRPGGRGPK